MSAGLVVEVVCRVVAGAVGAVEPDRSLPSRCMTGARRRRRIGLRLRPPCDHAAPTDLHLRRHRSRFSGSCARAGRQVGDYDPTTGTFTTRDPLDGVDGTITVANPYHYADNDPLNKTDPLGLRPTDDDTFDPDDAGPPDPMACAGVTNAPDFLGANPHPSGGATAQLYLFRIPVKYCKGVVRINGFISQPEVQFGFGKVDKFMGDNRGFDSRSVAQQSRASVELDFQRGLGRLFINYTCHTDGRCASADPIGVGNIDITTSRNWSGFNEFQHTLSRDRLELRFNWPNPASRVLGVAPCAITGKMTIDFGGDGDGVEVDNPVLRDFPSFEVYHYSGSRENVLLQQKEHDLPDLCASR